MTDKPVEQISELVDGELSGVETRQLLERLKQDDELKDTWARYHLISDAIKGEPLQAGIVNLAADLSRRLEQEPAIIALPQKVPARPVSDHGGGHWFKPALGVALAASVAGGAIMILPDVALTPTQDSIQTVGVAPPLLAPVDILPVAESTTPSRPEQYSKSTGTRWKNLTQPGVESKLNRYLVDHNELASPGGISGVVPYASFVSYDAED